MKMEGTVTSEKLCSNESDSVLIISDDSDNESVQVVELEETIIDLENEIITIDDSITSDKQDDTLAEFKIDPSPSSAPDFIPLFSNSRNGGLNRRKFGTNVMTDISCKKKKGIHSRSECAPVNVCQVVSMPLKKVIRNRAEKIPTQIQKNPLIQLSYPNYLNNKAMEFSSQSPRPVIIDGCNVAYGYRQNDFVMQGIILVVEYFKKRGHEEIVCFLPQNYRHKTRSLSEERRVCELEQEEILSYTPSRRFDTGERITSYDDRYIIQYATERQGVIISNDGYRDIIDEEPLWRETIEKRLINFTFARGIFMLPKDPLGPNGPTLDEMLKFP